MIQYIILMLYDHDYVICLPEILDDTQENTFARRSSGIDYFSYIL